MRFERQFLLHSLDVFYESTVWNKYAAPFQLVDKEEDDEDEDEEEEEADDDDEDEEEERY